MTCAIVSAPAAQSAFVTHNLAGHVLDVVMGGERIYVLHLVSGRAADMRFVDPFDGMLLIECKFFADERTARQWLSADIALHAAQIRGVH